MAQDSVVVRVNPASFNLPVGGTSDVAVEIVDVEGLYGFDIQLSFDPSIVEVVDADPNKPGDQVSLGRMLDSGMSVRDSADNSAGTIHYAMTQLNPSEAKNGTGNLIVIKLRAKTAGNSDLTITSLDLARRDASAIPASPESGAVTVAAAGSTTQPTNTPIPTQAPPTPVPTGFPSPTTATGQATIQQPTATSLPSTTSTELPPTATVQALSNTATATAVAETLPLDPTATASVVAPTDTPAPNATPAQVQVPEVSPMEPADNETTPDVVTTAPEQPGAAVGPTQIPTDTPQAVSAALNDDSATQNPAPSKANEPAGNNQAASTLLIVGVGALIVALVIGVVLIAVLTRRRTAS
ncbi:MAG: hypothetical protein KDI03_06450 [Anaerolineae bacterium]|nr:hypothetical protein [Anaerolineae bacterium]